MKRVLIVNDTSIENHHAGCWAVMDTLVSNLRTRGIEPVGYWPVGLDWKPFSKIIMQMNIDAIIVNGEGSIHSAEKRSRARFLCSIAEFAKKQLGVPAFLINASVYNIRDEDMQNLESYEGIYARETATSRYLSQGGICSRTVPDLSFFSKAESVPTTERDGIVFTDSVIEGVSEKMKKIASSNGSKYIKMSQPKTGIHGFEKINKFSRRVKLFAIKKFPNTIFSPIAPASKNITGCHIFESFVSDIANAEVLVTGRLHATTLALLKETPVVCIESNTPKISWILEDALGSTRRQLSHLPQDIGDLDIASHASYSSEELENLRSYLAKGRDDKDTMFDEIVSRINNQ